MRDHRVASMIKYKGDKAKKEFSIDNTVELNRIRDKYKDELMTEDNKHILPAFFAHISREKGYYDPVHKAYIPHDTSMDYLQTIVRRFRTKNKIPEPTSRIVDIFDASKYDSRWVNHKQISHIMKYVKKYAAEVSNVFKPSDHIITDSEVYIDDDMTTFEKMQLLNEQLIEEISNYRIGYHTMIFIIKQLERKDYYRYRNILLPILFCSCRQSFFDAIKKSEQDISILVEPGNEIFLYNFGYKIKQKSDFLTDF